MITNSSHYRCTLLMRCCKLCKLLLPDFSVTFHTTKTLSHRQKHEWDMTGFLSAVIDYYYQVKKTSVPQKLRRSLDTRGLQETKVTVILTQVGRVWLIMWNCWRKGKIRKPRQWRMTRLWEHYVCIEFNISHSFINSHFTLFQWPRTVQSLFTLWDIFFKDG